MEQVQSRLPAGSCRHALLQAEKTALYFTSPQVRRKADKPPLTASPCQHYTYLFVRTGEAAVDDDLKARFWGIFDEVTADLVKAKRHLREGTGSEMEVLQLRARRMAIR